MARKHWSHEKLKRKRNYITFMELAEQVIGNCRKRNTRGIPWTAAACRPRSLSRVQQQLRHNSVLCAMLLGARGSLLGHRSCDQCATSGCVSARATVGTGTTMRVIMPAVADPGKRKEGCQSIERKARVVKPTPERRFKECKASSVQIIDRIR